MYDTGKMSRLSKLSVAKAEEEDDGLNTQQVIFVNHLVQPNYDSERIRFILTCHKQHMHVVYNRVRERVDVKKQFDSNEITKTEVPLIHLQNIKIKLALETQMIM